MTKKTKILVVDDDSGILDALSFILKKSGYDVELQSDGEKMMTRRDNWPDLILLDNKLSGIEGIHICQHLKSQQESHHIPVILISAVHDLEEKFRIAGADDYMEKPFTTQKLLEKIRLNLEKKSNNR